MEQSTHSSRLLLWVGVAVVVVLVVVGIIVAVMLNTKQAAPSQTAVGASQDKGVTAETVQRNIATLDASLQQAKTDQAAAKNALNDEKNRVMVGGG